MRTRDAFENLFHRRETIMKRVLFLFFTLLIVLNTTSTDKLERLWLPNDQSIQADIYPEMVDVQTSLVYIKGTAPFSHYGVEFSFNGGQDWISLPELGGQVLSSVLHKGFFELSVSIEPQFFFGQLSYENGLKSTQKMKSFLIRAVSSDGLKTRPQALVLFYEDQKKKAAQWPAF